MLLLLWCLCTTRMWRVLVIFRRRMPSWRWRDTSYRWFLVHSVIQKWTFDNLPPPLHVLEYADTTLLTSTLKMEGACGRETSAAQTTFTCFQDPRTEPSPCLELFRNYSTLYGVSDLLCGLVVRVPGYRSRGPGSISGGTRFCEN
jgi:hypothetical protein